jgi:hypothetical protein
MSSPLDGAQDELRQTLEKLQTEQQQQEQQRDGPTPTDRSDGRADVEPSERVSANTGFVNTTQEQISLPAIQRQTREGYGFRPQSGASTPITAAATASPIPDPNGLGWPGESLFPRHSSSVAQSHPKPSPPCCIHVASQIHRLPTECHSCRTGFTRAKDGISCTDHPRVYW